MITLFKKCIVIAFILLFVSTVSVYAQTNNYTLTQLIDASKNYLPSLLQKQALINSAQAEVADVKHSFLPKLYVGDEVNVGTDN